MDFRKPGERPPRAGHRWHASTSLVTLVPATLQAFRAREELELRATNIVDEWLQKQASASQPAALAQPVATPGDIAAHAAPAVAVLSPQALSPRRKTPPLLIWPAPGCPHQKMEFLLTVEGRGCVALCSDDLALPVVPDSSTRADALAHRSGVCCTCRVAVPRRRRAVLLRMICASPCATSCVPPRIYPLPRVHPFFVCVRDTGKHLRRDPGCAAWRTRRVWCVVSEKRVPRVCALLWR